MQYKRQLNQFVRSIKFFFQRLFRGWDDSETWGLDFSLAKQIVPRLKKYKELNKGYPAELTWEQWNNHLDEMIFAFDWFLSEKRFDDIDDVEFARVQAGLLLFANFYSHLWW